MTSSFLWAVECGWSAWLRQSSAVDREALFHTQGVSGLSSHLARQNTELTDPYLIDKTEAQEGKVTCSG